LRRLFALIALAAAFAVGVVVGAFAEANWYEEDYPC